MSEFKVSLKSIGKVVVHVPVYILAVAMLSGCATLPGWIASDGPSRAQVQDKGDDHGLHDIELVDINDAVTRQLLANDKQRLFSDYFGTTSQADYVVGPGDALAVSIWEAQPALLFGGGAVNAMLGSMGSSAAPPIPVPASATTLPEQMVGTDGSIYIPFVGHLIVAGHDVTWIEQEIVRRLRGKANQPQVLVQVTRNATSTVTIVGDVNTNLRMPLTAGRERLLDALAAAGGAKQPLNKTTLQITRGNKVASLPLETVIRDPMQDIILQPGDVITAFYQPLSFTVLGATGKNDEINFEAQGISLAQAIARSGGLDNMRADARAVFIFRFEDKSALNWPSPPMTTPDDKVPVIYQLDLKDPAAFFVAQNFPVRNKDVLYVSNAPSAELQKFLSIVVSSVYPLVAAKTLNIVK